MNQRDKNMVERAYRRLEPEHKRIVNIHYRRHQKACERLGVTVEPSFLIECMNDVRAGILDATGYKDEQISEVG